MKKPLLVLVILLPAACATTETPATKGVRDPAYEKEKQARRDRLRKQRLVPEDIGKVLLDANVLLNDYFQARKAPGNTRVESHIVSVRKALQELVTVNFRRLVIAAEDPDYRQNRAVALAALGFAEEKEHREQVLLPLLNAMDAKEQAMVSNACLGLGELQDSRTPPGILADLLLDPKRDKTTRLNACWALTRLQEHYAPKEKGQLLSVWLRILRETDEALEPGRPVPSETTVAPKTPTAPKAPKTATAPKTSTAPTAPAAAPGVPEAPMVPRDPEILTPVVRAVGLFRNPDHARFVEPLTRHRTPSVRMNAAIALGRMGNQASHKVLLKLIQPAETNPNVRLAARKALQALAGNIDAGYDVEMWKSLFARQK